MSAHAAIRSMAERAARGLFGPLLNSFWLAIAPRSGWRSLIASFARTYLQTWALRGLVGFLVAYLLSTVVGAPYLYDAIRQALAPKFWNVVVMLGLLYAVAGAAFAQVVPKDKDHCAYRLSSQMEKYCHAAARAFLIFASELGALSFGIVVGMLLVATFRTTDTVSSLVGALGGSVLLGIVFIFNVIVWWIVYAVLDDNERPTLFQFWSEQSRLYKVVFSMVGFFILAGVTLFGGSA